MVGLLRDGEPSECRAETDGAGDGTRTRDILLGRYRETLSTDGFEAILCHVVLCSLSLNRHRVEIVC